MTIVVVGELAAVDCGRGRRGRVQLEVQVVRSMVGVTLVLDEYDRLRRIADFTNDSKAITDASAMLPALRGTGGPFESTSRSIRLWRPRDSYFRIKWRLLGVNEFQRSLDGAGECSPAEAPST